MTRGMIRAAVFAVLMAGAVGVATAWRPTHFIADTKPHVELKTLVPAQFGEWRVDDTIVPLQPSPDVQKVINETYEQTFAQTYRNDKGERVMLSLAYGRNQHEGMNTHRPEICYPAQGFQIVQSSQTGVAPLAGTPGIPVVRLVTAHPGRNEPITYWLIVGDEVTTFGRGHKMVTLRYGLLGKIPDGLLVRVSSIDPDNRHAFEVQERFIAAMLQAMTPGGREVMLGKLAVKGT